MQLTIVNLTGSTKTYLSGSISVAANSSFTAIDSIQKLLLYTEGQLHSDISNGLVQLTDGINTFASNDALDYLKLIPSSLIALLTAAKPANADPSSGSQLTNISNSLAPSLASLSNTTASYSTLGGQFSFNIPTGAETDYCLFAYQVPSTSVLRITDVIINTRASGSTNTNNQCSIEWSIAVNSSGASLATTPNPPIRTSIGVQTNGVNGGLLGGSIGIGNTYTPSNVSLSFKVPLICEASRYVQIITKIPIGTSASNQQIRGTVTILGYFE
jgi:hypothetical protein